MSGDDTPGGPVDTYAEELAKRVVQMFGPIDAPGILLQAMLNAHLEHHSLDALVFCLERTVVGLRADLAKQICHGGTIQ